MIAFLTRHFRRRRLKPVVSTLPARIAKSFAVTDHCTFGQAKRVIENLHLPQSVQPYAYVAVCHQNELETPLHLSADDYKRLRAELLDLFNLSSSDFKRGGGTTRGTPRMCRSGAGYKRMEVMGAGLIAKKLGPAGTRPAYEIREPRPVR
jgi:hypothetical protein